MENRKVIDTLIIDLDNTIFDWFAVWYASFRPIYDRIVKETGWPVDTLNESIRKIHQSRRTSEYTFLIEELDALSGLREVGDIRELFRDSVEESQKGRDENLRLYPSIFRSLWEIKKSGTRIIAYTESMSFYSAYRLKRFGLDGVIDVLFSPKDHDVPKGVSLDKLRRLPDDFYELQVTEIQHTPLGELKPNARVLLDIIKSVGASKERCAYVGDSIFKDVAMARDAGVYDIHAQYGESQKRPEYRLLQDVSHWTEEDVQREREITSRGSDFVPSAVLKDTFSEIFIYCDFVKFPDGNRSVPAEEERKNVLEIWKKCVDVQQHFNDIELRIRNFAITLVGALIAAIGFTYQQGLYVQIAGLVLPAGVGIVVAAAFAWCGFFLMDRYWYHILLKGAVLHASIIEKKYKNEIPELGLGSSISSASSGLKLFGVQLNSDRRLAIFYILGFVALFVVFAVLVFAQPRLSGVPVSLPAGAAAKP